MYLGYVSICKKAKYTPIKLGGLRMWSSVFVKPQLGLDLLVNELITQVT